MTINDWLDTPSWIVDEALENLIVLQAEERLAVVTNVGLGTGSIGKNESRKILNDLRRQSISRRTPADRTEDRGSVEDFQKQVEGIGIGVEIIGK